MQPSKARTLRVKRETLRNLSTAALRRAGGATIALSPAFDRDTGTCPDPSSTADCSESGCVADFTSIVIPPWPFVSW